MKKDFKLNNPAARLIGQSEPYTHDTQQEQDTLKTQDAPDVLRTQGRKGKKLQRINMAFQPDNLDYLQLISRIEGISMTDYVNRMLQADRIARADIVAQARNILKGVEK